MYRDIEVTKDQQVATVTINRPQRKNAVTVGMWEDLLLAFRELARSPERVVVVAGAGGDFCAGADLSEPAEDVRPLDHMHLVGDVCLALHRLTKPTIARVDGVAVGAGMNLALACDFVVASARARFSEIFPRRGLSIDFGGAWILPRLIGLHRAKELAMLGDMLDAAQAREYGIINRVVPAEELDVAVSDLAARLAAGPPVALSLTKRLLNDSFDSTLEQTLEAEARAQAVNLVMADAREAARAFMEKRPPKFEGR